MLSNSSITQYSPNSEEADEQPLDFSKTRISALRTIGSIPIKNETNNENNRIISPQEPQRSTPSTAAASNCFTTPSPSPPEHLNNHNNHTNQVLCQLLTGSLIPTSTGKLVPARNNTPISLQMPTEPSLRFSGVTAQSSPLMPTSAQNPVMQAMNSVMNERHNERHNSSISPSGSASPIGLGPLNQVDMHFSHSPNASGVDRFGTSGGLLTTASAAGVFAGNENAKRALKYSRPFKAYPRDPLSIPMSYYGVPLQMPLSADAIATQSLLATASDQAYLQFREQMLVSRKSTQEPRRTTVPKQMHNNSTSTSSTPERIADNHINSNNNSNSNNNTPHQNIYLNRSLTPTKEMMAPLPKTNGSASMTPMTPQIHSDENSQYSNGNSSGNSSAGEGDVGSLASTTGGLSDAQNMRKRGRPLPEDLKDDAYWERRRKNNEAAKRSRDARRAKEDEIAIRAAFLEQENLKLRCEIAQLKTETTKLRCLLYNS